MFVIWCVEKSVSLHWSSFLHPSGMMSENVDVCRSLPDVVDPRWGKHLAVVLQVATRSIVEHTQDGRPSTILLRSALWYFLGALVGHTTTGISR